MWQQTKPAKHTYSKRLNKVRSMKERNRKKNQQRHCLEWMVIAKAKNSFFKLILLFYSKKNTVFSRNSSYIVILIACLYLRLKRRAAYCDHKTSCEFYLFCVLYTVIYRAFFLSQFMHIFVFCRSGVIFRLRHGIIERFYGQSSMEDLFFFLSIKKISKNFCV